MEIFHGNIEMYCLDVFVEHNIFKLPSIAEIFMAFEIHFL